MAMLEKSREERLVELLNAGGAANLFCEDQDELGGLISEYFNGEENDFDREDGESASDESESESDSDEPSDKEVNASFVDFVNEPVLELGEELQANDEPDILLGAWQRSCKPNVYRLKCSNFPVMVT
jgi:hypothetical protein